MIGFHWPDDAKLAFAIRDDDVCYFTQPWMLETVYKEAWKLGFKVSLSVIPYVRATRLRLVPPHLRKDGKYYSVSENKELIGYLREKMFEGFVDVIQHGYSHERNGLKPEFASKDYVNLTEKLKKGRRLLRDALEQNITVFAAPHERISRAAMRSLHENAMNLCRKFTVGKFLMMLPFSLGNLRKAGKLLLLNPIIFGPIKDKVIPLDNMLVIQWDVFLMGKDITHDITQAKGMFVKSLVDGSTFVLAQHYWEYFDSWNFGTVRKERLSKFNEFLHFVASKKHVWKTSLSEIVDWIKNSGRFKT